MVKYHRSMVIYIKEIRRQINKNVASCTELDLTNVLNFLAKQIN